MKKVAINPTTEPPELTQTGKYTLGGHKQITVHQDPVERSSDPIRGATPRPRSEAEAGRSYLTPEARGGSQDEQPHVQGEVAARAQEGLEELFHVQGQEGRR